MSKRVLIAAPRSFCAGVVRAIDIVEKLLETHGPPVYVRHEIVHNVHVVEDLEARGAIFVDTEQEVPRALWSSCLHTASRPQVYRKCAERNLEVIDATCPLVSKVHAEAAATRRGALRSRSSATPATKRWSARWGGARVDRLVETVEDASNSRSRTSRPGLPDPDDPLGRRHGKVVDALRERFPDLVGLPSADICYATQNRQDAVKKICEQATLVLVVGSRTSSNANRLVEVAKTSRRRRLPDRRRERPRAFVALRARDRRPDRRSLLARAPRRPRSPTGWPISDSLSGRKSSLREDVYFRLPARLR